MPHVPAPSDCASFPLHGQLLLPTESRPQLHATSVFQCFNPDRVGTRNPQSTLHLLPTWLSGRPCLSHRLPARPVLKPWLSVRRVGCHLGLRERLVGRRNRLRAVQRAPARTKHCGPPSRRPIAGPARLRARKRLFARSAYPASSCGIQSRSTRRRCAFERSKYRRLSQWYERALRETADPMTSDVLN